MVSGRIVSVVGDASGTRVILGALVDSNDVVRGYVIY